MPNRGGGRGGRGGRGGVFKGPRNDRGEIIRVGGKLTYAQKNVVNTRSAYKFVKNQPINSSVAQVSSDDKVKELAKSFLKTYYELFDTLGRANLQSQYSSDAFFSFSATHEMPVYGRNLLKLPSESRNSLLLHDKTNIAQALAQKFSPTEHLIDCITCDVPYYTVNPMYITSMQIVVTGTFKDLTLERDPLKAFTRVFTLKQASVDKGKPVYEIYNDLFMLQHPTPEQIKRSHLSSRVSKRSGTFDQQETMIKSVMAKTKMNREGSKQLLVENDWDETKAVDVFNQLLAQNPGKIPQDLFIN